MKFVRYPDIAAFAGDTLEILLENEAQNNLPISFLTREEEQDTSGWLLAAVKDSAGGVALTCVCTPPFNLVLCETRNAPNSAAVELLAGELRAMGYAIPGAHAEQGLAHRFAEAYAGAGGFTKGHSMNVMRLDRVEWSGCAPGQMRPMREADLFFAPYWDRAFAEDCRVEHYSLSECVERAKKRLAGGVHFFWEDGGIPVSQAANGRNTVNGAVVSFVYTPPHYRGKGYASALVAELSQLLLERGRSFCCLFADAANPISCGIYRKLGYRDVCVYDDLKFKGEQP